MHCYLKRVGFNRCGKNKKYIKRNGLDNIASLMYSAISLVCMWNGTASLLVLFLNSLCFIRTILKNTMKSSEITDVIKEHLGENNIKNEVIGKYYYFFKAVIQLTVLVLFTIILVLMNFDLTEKIIKLFTSIIIVMIYIDDFENMLIDIYDASIEPIIS